MFVSTRLLKVAKFVSILFEYNQKLLLILSIMYRLIEAKKRNFRN